MKLLFKGLALLLATATAASSAAEGGSRILIYNGDDVVAGTYPWFAYPFNLSTGDWDGCGGSLISAEYVLTAAHCIVDENKVPYDALDAYNIGALCAPYTQKNNCGQDVEVFSILKSIIHPSYGMPDNDNDNDFALVKLDGSANATPVNIDDGTYSPAYANGKGNLWPIGFGKATLDDSPGEVHYPERLQHVEVKYITNAKCVSDYSYEAGEITGNMMCARDNPSEYLQKCLLRVPTSCDYFESTDIAVSHIIFYLILSISRSGFLSRR
jgi:secreted trypsin-like serine protease